MNTRKITLLGPEGTNLTLLTIFLILNFVSWLTLFTLSGGLSFNLQNSVFRQISFLYPCGAFVFCNNICFTRSNL